MHRPTFTITLILGTSLGLALTGAAPPAVVTDKPVRGGQQHEIGGPVGDEPIGLAELEAHISAEAAAERFSGVVLIARDGEPIFHLACGYASRRFKVENRLDTKFNIGSINKLFTTVAIYQLVEKGLIEIDDTIGKHLRGLPKDVADKVTIDHLLTHRSGWGDYFDKQHYARGWRDLRTLDAYMSFIKDVPLDFEPGTSQQYSNIGFVVLGSVIENVTGQSYYDYVREHIFEPSGMLNTDSYEMDLPVENLAIGYSGGGYQRNNYFRHSVRGTSAGGGFSTAEDLLRFANAIRDDVLLEPEHGGRLKSIVVAGGAPGINAFMATDVSGGHTVIVLSNFDPPAAMDLGERIMEGLPSARTARRQGDRPPSPYRIGIGFKNINGRLSVGRLTPGGAAAKAGLRPGDLILSLNGSPMEADPIAQIRTLLKSPDPIAFGIRRDGEELEIKVVPEPAR